MKIIYKDGQIQFFDLEVKIEFKSNGYLKITSKNYGIFEVSQKEIKEIIYK